MFNYPTPHGDKLQALLSNPKLPKEDQSRVQKAIREYEQWLKRLAEASGDYTDVVTKMVTLLNHYKKTIELELIFDSEQNFLYRKKGQLKLDNTIIEEFLPILVMTALKTELQPYKLQFGPTTCFSSIRFESSITIPAIGGGMKLREKDHDFAIGRQLFIQTSYTPDFQDSTTVDTCIAYVAAECKTNLDRTMFQEAAATALDIKTSVPGAKYYLLCEWLDMTPINTSTTAIDEILILRKAKRLSSNIRSRFNTAANRRQNRTHFKEYLEAHPFVIESFDRFLQHIRRMVADDMEDSVLEKGYF